MKVLVINSGSSSLKAQLMETDTNEVLAKAYCQRIGLDKAFMEYKTSEKRVIEHDMPTHKEAFELLFATIVDKEIGVISSLDEVKAVGHRMVNFGEKYNKSIVVTEEIYNDLQKCVHFAPLHNPPALIGIRNCMDLMPDKKNVAVFDTAFHATMPEKAYMYAIPYEFYSENKIRRYGAHGTSHRYIAMKCAEIMGDLKGKKIISCHLGSGSSVCAIKDGICVDTSMGFTPLAGLVMGTRSGDIDPSVIKDIMNIKDISIDETINLLNKKSGAVGLCGYSDMRDIEANFADPKAKLTFDMMVYSIKKYIGSYAAAMNGVDAIVFTAGIGERDEKMREAVCQDMEYLGLEFDAEKNITMHKPFDLIQDYSKPSSKVRVYRIPTDEEYIIAMDTATLAK
ncbi:MAG: acetate kinase [Clostridiales bacterium]|nr:acetate kinase [Clostridiales bacterium]